MARFVVVLLMALAVLLVGIAFVVAHYLRDIRAARKRIDGLGSQLLETGMGPVEYKQVGEGYPLLVVHGAMGGFDQGLWLAQAASLSNYRIIAISRFGYLRSALPENANLDMQADAFACLLDTLEIRQAAVFGASAGSTAALRFAVRYPERISALILFGPDAPGSTQMALPPRFVFDTLLRSDFVYWTLITLFGKWVQNQIGLAPKGYTLTPEHKAMLKKIQTGDLPVSRRVDGMLFESYMLLPEFMESVSPAARYPLCKIEIPVLVINAADDPISIPENVHALAALMPNARLFVLPEGGHFLFGHMEEVKVEIAQFLNSNLPLLPNTRGRDE